MHWVLSPGNVGAKRAPVAGRSGSASAAHVASSHPLPVRVDGAAGSGLCSCRLRGNGERGSPRVGARRWRWHQGFGSFCPRQLGMSRFPQMCEKGVRVRGSEHWPRS